MTGRKRCGTAVFLLIEAVLYTVVVIPGFHGRVCHPLRFLTILVCAVYSLILTREKRDSCRIWLSAAMLLTALADFCFEILQGQELPALFIFVVVQFCHGIRLRICFGGEEKRAVTGLDFVGLRAALPALFLLILAWSKKLPFGLQDLAEMEKKELVMLSLMLVYGMNILCNQITAMICLARERSPASLCMTLGFFLFILCDITVAAWLLYPRTGLSWIVTERLAEMTWVFYIPSQVLLVLSAVFGRYSMK